MFPILWQLICIRTNRLCRYKLPHQIIVSVGQKNSFNVKHDNLKVKLKSTTQAMKVYGA